MLRHVTLYKRIGETPLQTIEAWKDVHTEYKEVPASYAGRLDPMASGKLLVLLGDECKKQSTYTGLDKEYEIELVLDIATDTGDALGMPVYEGISTQPETAVIKDALIGECGTHTLPYPAYSSKTVNGTPLFVYALSNTLDTITIPTHNETFYGLRLLFIESFSKDTLHARIQKTLESVPRSLDPRKALGADFRQDTIRPTWSSMFSQMPERSFMVLRVRVTCGSGAYMRTLAGRIGKALGTSAFTLSIRRTRIGRYTKLPFGLCAWTRTY